MIHRHMGIVFLNSGGNVYSGSFFDDVGLKSAKAYFYSGPGSAFPPVLIINMVNDGRQSK